MYAGKLTSLALALGTRNSPSGPTGPRARTSDRLSGPSGPRGSDPRPRALRARGLGSLPRGACQLPDGVSYHAAVKTLSRHIILYFMYY